MIRNPETPIDYPLPAARRLRIYAFDPHASVELATAVINDAVIQLPWESRWETPLGVGPVNDYLEVIDHDPSSGVFYAPVDLGHPTLLAQDGLPPSEGRPQFHQQMVFAVAMRTIRAFERALGRGVLWAGDPKRGGDPDSIERDFTPRLRIYPHALREPNAYYSPQKRALLFGYFRPKATDGTIDASWVFTCLSQDIIAHETTHAILHGLQQRSIEPSNVDALAFHEAFADIVALLQHFGMGAVLRHQLAESRGSLRSHGLLTGLGQQFGRATGHKGALRFALDLLRHDAVQRDVAREGGNAPSASPDPAQGAADQEAGKAADKDADSAKPEPSLRNTFEPHARGGYLVAAVFDAFVTIYERRASDLLRIAGVKPGTRIADRELAPDLVARLASEAAKAADHVLRMCVRALDYIPPVDLRFGEYLRAIVTADTDLVPDDPMRYRVAFVEAFKKRGITVPGCISMAPDSLLWTAPDLSECRGFASVASGGHDAISVRFTRLLKRLQLSVAFNGDHRGSGKGGDPVTWTVNDFKKGAHRNLRELSTRIVLHNQCVIQDWFTADRPGDEDWETLLGMRLLPPDHRYRRAAVPPMGSIDSKWDQGLDRPGDVPLFEVGSARIARRSGPNGEEQHQLIIQIIQRRRAYFDPEEQKAAEIGNIDEIGRERWDNPDFWFYGGATLHVDLRDGRLLRIIRKRIDQDTRLAEERSFRIGDEVGQAMAAGGEAEPFAFMHRSAKQ